jgi:hypothetical protein
LSLAIYNYLFINYILGIVFIQLWFGFNTQELLEHLSVLLIDKWDRDPEKVPSVLNSLKKSKRGELLTDDLLNILLKMIAKTNDRLTSEGLVLVFKYFFSIFFSLVRFKFIYFSSPFHCLLIK